MLNLLVGALSGIPMGLARQGGADAPPRYLTMVHLGGLMQGPALIAVGFALSISDLSAWINTTAAGLLAFGSGMLVVKDTLNWRQGVKDEFVEKSTGLTIGNAFAPVHLLGIILATIAVLSGI